MPRLGLALSGGGLRATLFHLGVVRFLHDAGRLGEVTHVVSVSGGGILGAHLALIWGRYTGSTADFQVAAARIIDFVQTDARNQIAQRIPFLDSLRFLQRLSLRGPSRTFTPTELLEKLYAKHLYGDARVHQLAETPELHLLATNVSGGPLLVYEGRPDHAASDERMHQGRYPSSPPDPGRAGGHGVLGLSRILLPPVDHGRRPRAVRRRVFLRRRSPTGGCTTTWACGRWTCLKTSTRRSTRSS